MEVMPSAFIDTSSDACTWADLVIRSGSAIPTRFEPDWAARAAAWCTLVLAEAAPAKPALSVRAPAVATAAARLSLVVGRLVVGRLVVGRLVVTCGDGGRVKAGEVIRAFAVLSELLRKTMVFPALIINL
jgi:hypothetical protein